VVRVQFQTGLQILWPYLRVGSDPVLCNDRFGSNLWDLREIPVFTAKTNELHDNSTTALHDNSTTALHDNSTTALYGGVWPTIRTAELNDQQTQRQPRLFNNLAATRQRAL
jgi:hypothetical protein